MAITVLVEFSSKPEDTDALKQFMADALPDTRAYDGCISLDVCNSDDNFVIVAQWESREHQEKYLAWRIEQGAFEKLGGLLEDETSIRYFETLDI